MQLAQGGGREWRIRDRLTVLGVVPFVVLALVLAAVAWVAVKTERYSGAIRVSDEQLTVSGELLTTLVDAETGMRGYVLTGNRAFLRPLQEAAKRLQPELRSADALRAKEPLALEPDMAALARAAFAADWHLVSLVERGNRNRALLEFESGNRRMDAFRAANARAKDRALDARREAAQDLQRSWLITYVLLGFGVLAGLGTTTTLHVTISRGVVNRLNRVGEAAYAVTQGIPPGPALEGNDEISVLDRLLRNMLSDMKARDDLLASYKLFAEHGQDVILFIDTQSRIVEANAAALRAYGYTREEFYALRWSELHVPQNEIEIEATLALVRSTGTMGVETMHARKNGDPFPVEISYDAVDVDGNVLVLVVARDITERRQAEAAFAATYEQAVEASRLKSQFVATMSHEIRTPMNAVIGMNELLLDTTLNADQREYARTARDSGFALLGVIDDILDFSKMEAGKLEIVSLELDIAGVVESVAAMFAHDAQLKGISLVTYVDPHMRRTVRGDEGRLRQVLLSLTGNAVKFTERGGVVILVTTVAETKNVSTCRFSVKDTGVGFEAALGELIFEPFRQGDGTTTRKYGGAGLGLSISKQLVELMGGELSVASTPGVGSEFAFTVTFASAPQELAKPAPSLLPGNVLIVDDDPFVREIFHKYMLAWGIRNAVADGSETALAMMHRAAEAGAPFDLALIDYEMPPTSGLELGRSIKADPSLAAAQLIMMTAYDGVKRGEIAIANGFSAYLTKPMRQSLLYDCLMSVMSRAPAPEAPSGQAGFASRPREAETYLRPERILVAEDTPVNQRLAVQQLKKLGFAAEVVADGQQALAALGHDAFDLVFMDCQMPLVDGYMATREIRKGEARTGRHVPIVAMTANARREDREACLAAGMDDYLAKPVQLAQIRAMLDRWIPANVN